LIILLRHDPLPIFGHLMPDARRRLNAFASTLKDRAISTH
jgi:hypothetical protein